MWTTPLPCCGAAASETGSLFTALGSAWTRGTAVDWDRVFGTWHARLVDLPTYPFQRERYWAENRQPLLGAAVPLASGDGVVLTGRLSVATQPWLADHVVAGAVVLPGTAFVELALHPGHGRVGDLTIESPLVLPEHGAVDVQVFVAADGAVAIHARPDRDDAPWTRHATGIIDDGPDAGEPYSLPAWPPPGAEPIDLDDLYPALAEVGLAYGPTFRGLRSAWRVGDEVFADVVVPDATDGFELHPALLDAALHAIAAGGLLDGGGALVPFAWSGVSLHTTGAASLRVRLGAVGPDSVRLDAWDGTGAPVVSVDSLALRPVARGHARSVEDALLAVQWVPVSLPVDSSAFDRGGGAVRFVRDVAHAVLATIQERLASRRRSRSWC